MGWIGFCYGRSLLFYLPLPFYVHNLLSSECTLETKEVVCYMDDYDIVQ